MTNPQSFEALDKWRDGFIQNAGPDDVKTFPFVLIGNKVDLPARRVEAAKAQAWCAQNNNINHYETSAKEGTQVADAFLDMVRKAIKRDPKDNIILPDNIAGGGLGGGGLKLSAKKSGAGTQVQGNRCC